MAKAYRIRDWEKMYENSRTRTMGEMRWVPIPNKHDGMGYIELVSGKHGAAMLGCWLALTQVASKCHPRGTLLRGTGKPHNAASISAITRLPVEDMQRLLDKASSNDVGWLEVIEIEDVASSYQEGDRSLSRTCQAPITEEKEGIEGNGRNGIENNVNSHKTKLPQQATTGFLRFWESYPSCSRKVAKDQCRKKWEKENLEPLADTIVAHVQASAKSQQWKNHDFIPMPATYLNQRRWEAPATNQTTERKRIEGTIFYEAPDMTLEEAQELMRKAREQ